MVKVRLRGKSRWYFEINTAKDFSVVYPTHDINLTGMKLFNYAWYKNYLIKIKDNDGKTNFFRGKEISFVEGSFDEEDKQ